MDATDAPAEIRALFAQAAQAPAPVPAVVDGPAEELTKLNGLRLKGVLTDAEFEAAKARVLKT